MIVLCTSSRPVIASTNALPLKRTARFAVAPAAAIASRLLAPARALLAKARHDEERVVDPEREAHPDQHVRDEQRQLPLGGDERGQAERHRDRDDRKQQRQRRGDERAEDDHEHDQRGGQTETQLAVLQVALRHLSEVVDRT